MRLLLISSFTNHIFYQLVHLCKAFIVDGIMDFLPYTYRVYKTFIPQDAQVLGCYRLFNLQLLVNGAYVNATLTMNQLYDSLAQVIIDGTQYQRAFLEYLNINWQRSIASFRNLWHIKKLQK